MNATNLKVKVNGEDVTSYYQNLHIDQEVGQHHTFELYLTNEDRAASFKGTLANSSKKWIGQSLSVDGLFEGIITSVGLMRNSLGSSTFAIRGYSPTILMDDGQTVKSFSEQTLQQIVDTVMGNYQSKFNETSIKPQYKKKLKYTVQFRETNFGFVNRLAARYGEWFYYDGAKLIFGKPDAGNPLRLNFGTDINQFDIAVRSVPLQFKMAGYDYKSHKFFDKKSDYAEPQNEYAKIALKKSKDEVFTNVPNAPIHFSMSKEDMDDIAALRQNVHLSEIVVLHGSSSNTSLRPGMVIEIVDSRSGFEAGGADNYGKYIITQISHEFSTHSEAYSNHFEAIPSDSVLPPLQVSPDPPPAEMQLAEVMENNDPDALGRIKVQFAWQKESNEKTPWIRMASHSGGGDKGLYIIPEKGDQVMVAFENNHPERPFALTGMYHGQAKPEHHNSDNYKKALKTKGGHQILMNDEKGKESMALSSPKDLSAAATSGDMNLTAKGKITIKSDSGDITIDTPATIKIHASKIEINADASISLAAPKIEIKADAELNASGAKVNVDGQAATTVKGGGMLNVESQGITSISGSMLKLN